MGCKNKEINTNISDEKNEMNEELNRKKWYIAKKAGKLCQN